MFLHNVYEIEPTRSNYLCVVEWDELGAPHSMCYPPDQVPSLVERMEAAGLTPTGTIARAVSKEINQGKLF